jgi:hypothetical protein
MTPAPIIAVALAVVTMQGIPRPAKVTCDIGLIVGGAVSTVMGWLPAISALVAIVWGCLNIYVLYRDKLRKP